MAQVGLDPEAAGGASVFDLPKLTPKQQGERKRIWVPDPKAIRAQYVHALGGKKAQQPGMPEPAWGGNWLCGGDDATLRASNPFSDPANCLICRLHKEGNVLVGKCQRKFITQVVAYNTDPSGNLLNPFGVQALVWQFSDRQYRALSEIQSQWGEIRERDLLLVCDNIAFKQWDTIMALPEVVFTRQQDWIDNVTQTWQSQGVDAAELERILGRQASNDQEILAKLTEITPAGAAPAVAYQPPAIPGMPAGYVQQPLGQAPQQLPPQMPAAVPQPGFAPPPSADLYPTAGPFDQQQQTMAIPGQAAMPQPMGQQPPAMPMTPAPAQQAAPPMPQVPDLAQDPTPYTQQPQAPAAMPQAAPAGPPAMGVPDLTQPPPMAQQQPAPQAPPAMPAGPPPMAMPGVQPAPGAPAAPPAANGLDLQALMQAPPPPPPA